MIGKKFKTVILAISLITSFGFASNAYAIDAKAKALATMALYGTVGGAMLGTASLAFGTSERSIAVGASLGLYAGLLFGGYVVLTHAAKKNNWNLGGPGDYFDDGASPYSDQGQGGENYYDNAGDGGLFQYRELQNVDMGTEPSFKKFYQKKTGETPAFYMNLINYNF